MTAPLVIVVTGASGFVGARVVSALAGVGHVVRACVREAMAPSTGVEPYLTGDLIDGPGWERAFEGADVLVHCAGAAHVRNAEPSWLHRVNADGSRRVAECAAAAGIGRVVFASSLKVHGDSSGAEPLQASSPLRPGDAYARSKLEGELALREIAAANRLELVVLRPPLMYGPGVSANFLKLLTAVSQRRPLPVALVRNRRSLLAVGNFADAVRVCFAAGLVFLVMRQVMPMAAGLASGLALSSFGALSAAMAWGLGTVQRSGGQFARGLLLDRETTRWDGLSRKAGYYVGRGVAAGAARLTSRPNSISQARASSPDLPRLTRSFKRAKPLSASSS